MMHRDRSVLAVLLLLGGIVSAVVGQDAATGLGTQPAAPAATTGPVTAPSPATVPAPATAPVLAPFPLAEVMGRAEDLTQKARGIEADLANDAIAPTIGEALPGFSREVDARLAETAYTLAAGPTLETLRTLEAGW